MYLLPLYYYRTNLLSGMTHNSTITSSPVGMPEQFKTFDDEIQSIRLKLEQLTIQGGAVTATGHMTSSHVTESLEQFSEFSDSSDDTSSSSEVNTPTPIAPSNGNRGNVTATPTPVVPCNGNRGNVTSTPVVPCNGNRGNVTSMPTPRNRGISWPTSRSSKSPTQFPFLMPRPFQMPHLPHPMLLPPLRPHPPGFWSHPPIMSSTPAFPPRRGMATPTNFAPNPYMIRGRPSHLSTPLFGPNPSYGPRPLHQKPMDFTGLMNVI